jgi:hypothetical protein
MVCCGRIPNALVVIQVKFSWAEGRFDQSQCLVGANNTLKEKGIPTLDTRFWINYLILKHKFCGLSLHNIGILKYKPDSGDSESFLK